MKHLIILLLILVCNNCFSQYNDDYQSERFKDRKPKIIEKETSGSCLVKASNSFISGIVVGVIGGGLYVYSAKNTALSNPTKIFGIIGLSTACILEIRGLVLIGRSGRLKKEEEKLSLIITPNRVGLAFKF